MERRFVSSMLVIVATAMVCATMLATVSGKAKAAFPGANGRIAFAACTYELLTVACDPNDAEIVSMRPDGTDRRPLTDNLFTEDQPAFSPDGKTIAFTKYRGGRFGKDIAAIGGGGGFRNLTNREGTQREPAFSPDGGSIAFSMTDGNIYVMNADGTGVRSITDYPESGPYAQMPAWSPDGTKIAFGGSIIEDSGLENFDVYTMNVDGTDLTRLTSGPRHEFYPAWSPDGNKIAFHSETQSDGEIHIMDADGSDRWNLTDNAGPDHSTNPAWSPGGGKIAFVGYTVTYGDNYRDGDHDVYKIDIDGTDLVNLTNTPNIEEYDPDWGRRPMP